MSLGLCTIQVLSGEFKHLVFPQRLVLHEVQPPALSDGRLFCGPPNSPRRANHMRLPCGDIRTDTCIALA